MHGGGGGRRRILNKDYTLLRDDQDPDDIEVASKKSGASAWRLIGLAKEQALVKIQGPQIHHPGNGNSPLSYSHLALALATS